MVDGAFIDKGSNIISSVGLLLLPAVRVPNMRNIEPMMGSKQQRLNGIGMTEGILETVVFYFHFRGHE